MAKKLKMVSIRIKFRPSTVADHEGTIYYQIIHERRPRQLLSDYHVFPSEWDARRSTVTAVSQCERRDKLLSVREGIRRDVWRLNRIVSELEAAASVYTADDVVEEFKRYVGECTLCSFMERLIVNLRQNGRVRTSETYSSALRSFRRFLRESHSLATMWRSDDIMLDVVTSEVMEAYEAWHLLRGIAPNTISFYLRILRAVYNRAVEEGLIDDCKPFRRVYTGVGKTMKRALPLRVIRQISSLDLSPSPALGYARDMFMLSFMLRGMSFVDMAYLRKSDLECGYITYRRRKTGQKLVIEWTREMQQILDRYPENTTGYLLPIIRKPVENERCVYLNASYNINRCLKLIAGMVGVTMPLTLYVARHSWASVAKAKGIPVSVISEGMGHDSETTTRIYLASLDTSEVDKANSMIISSL